MNKTIEFYSFPPHSVGEEKVTIPLPLRHTILSCMARGKTLGLYVLHELYPDEDACRTHSFYTYLAGDTLPRNPGKYIATVEVEGFGFVNVFEEPI